MYYKEKKSIIDDPLLYSSDIITNENVIKVLKSKYCGMGLNDPTIPFPSTSWRVRELFYDHNDLGSVYIPKNIRFTDGKTDFYIVLIDTTIDIVSYSFRDPATRDSNGNPKFPVAATKEEFNQVEKSFYALIDSLGINKSIEERYKKVRGSRIKRESVAALVETVSTQLNHESLIDNVFSATLKPVAFYKDNIHYLEQLEIDEPSKEMYIFILITELEKNNLIWTLDWKSSNEDINYAISKLSNGKITEAVDATVTNQSTPKMFKMASARLQKLGLALLNVETDTDSYSIILAEEEKVQEIIQLAKECKIKITPCPF